MAKETFRNVRKNRYTQISNDLLWDKELSLQAKGLLSIFISNSKEWELNMKEIISRSKNGRDAHYGVVNELIKHGYFARVEVTHAKTRQFVEMVYIFSDDKKDVITELEMYKGKENIYVNLDKKGKKSPFPENQETAKKPLPENQDSAKKPFPENQETENKKTGNQLPENQYINNNKGNNTNLNNTKLNNSQSINQALNELYEKKSIPIPILKILSINSNRLTDDNIHPYEIETFYNNFTEHKLDDEAFSYVLSNVLKSTKNKITSFPKVMKKSAKNYYSEYRQEENELDELEVY